MPLLSDIESATEGQSACSLLQVPVRAMRSAADQLDSMKNNPPAGIQQLAAQLQQVELPRISGVDALADGIRSLRTQLPDAGELTQPIADAMGTFFGAISDNLSGRLDELLSSFTGLDTLATLGNSESIPSGFSDVLIDLQAGLAAIPDPLTVPALLQWLQEGLEKFPRGLFRTRYLPLIDELREKLQTTLYWNTLDGNGLVGEVAQTVGELETFVRRTFVDDGVDVVGDRLTALSDGFDEALLTQALDGLLLAIDAVAVAVLANDLPSANAAINALPQHQGDIQTIAAKLNAENPTIDYAKARLTTMPDELEDRAIHFLSIIQPPHDLEPLGLLLQPLNQVIEASGINMMIGKLGEFVASIRGLLDSLNISSFKDAFLQVLHTAEAGVNGLREVLMNVSIEFSALMERVKQAIQGLGISSAIDAMENGLRNFVALVRQTADTIFAPVRNFLMGVFQTINGFLDQLDPTVVVQALKNILSTFTDLLGNPQLLDAIDSVKAALDTVNGELGTFTFKPGTDIVVQGIDIVEKALQIASALPLPDSIKKELRDALNKLPRSLDPAVVIISDGLDEIIDEGPKPVLLQIKNGPAKLVEIVSAYAPEKLVTECLGTTFQDLLTEMERFKPTSLLVPIQQALDVVKTEIRRIADPTEALKPLQAPFDELILLIDAFDPDAIIAPLNDQLQDGIQAIIEILPINAANAIFDQVAAVAVRLQDASDTLTSLHDFMESLRLRLAGLANAKQQAQALGLAIAARIDQVSNIGPVTAAMTGLGLALADIHAAPLLTRINDPLAVLTAQFGGTNAKLKLAQIAAKLQTFPEDELRSLAGTPARDTIIAFIDEFAPISAAIAAPFDLIDTLPAQLLVGRDALATYLQDWDQRFLPAAGPIIQLHRPALTAAELKTMLSDTVEQQLTHTLEPIMQIVGYLQQAVDGVVLQVAQLIQDVNEVLVDIIAITDALEELRDAANVLIETLLGFDLSFLSDGFRLIFDTIKDEFSAFSPAHIGEILGRAFDEILAILEIDELLGAAALDDEYHEIIENLRRLDPGKILIEALQPEFEKVLAFLLRFDLTIQIDAFLANIDRLKIELVAELNRVGDAYEGMWDAIPSSIGNVTGRATVTITLTPV